MKQKIINHLRKTNLLAFVDNMRMRYLSLKDKKRNKTFAQQTNGFTYPPYDIAYDAYGGIDYKFYYESGKASAEYIAGLIKHYLPQNEIKVCEWGCGPARIIRHLADALPDKNLQLTGCDYNLKSINWCKENLHQLSFSSNILTPPLNFADDFFDFLYSVSVFTHLSEEMHYEWLKENLRVVRSGALIMLTTHGDKFKTKLLNDELVKYERGELVVRGNIQEGKRMYCAFHSPSFMLNKLLSGLEVLFHDTAPIRELSGGQDVWLIRKL
jgi:SAM-dependent methyltransferase